MDLARSVTIKPTKAILYPRKENAVYFDMWWPTIPQINW